MFVPLRALLVAAALVPLTTAYASDVGGYLSVGDRAFAVPAFETVDADGDRAISRDELALWFTADDPAVDTFAAFDTDGDGRVTADEYADLQFDTDPHGA